MRGGAEERSKVGKSSGERRCERRSAEGREDRRTFEEVGVAARSWSALNTRNTYLFAEFWPYGRFF